MPLPLHLRLPVLILVVAIVSAGCGGGGSSGDGAPATGSTPDAAAGGGDVVPKRSPLAALGERIFNDTSLSQPPGQSCASCHREELAHASHDVVQAGAVAGRHGTRNSPSLRYLKFSPDFTWTADGPLGGFFRDGRARTLTAQAQGPFLNPLEMNNGSADEVIARIAAAPYAKDFEAVWGAGVLGDARTAFDRMATAIAAYQREADEFAPFSSRFDRWRTGQGTLSERELRGMALFNDPAKGNCAACHPSKSPAPGVPPLFTDFSYDALGVPRNPAIPANADPSFHDLGVCGPTRTDASDPRGCGAFKVPTLRNIAVTAPYFHNGAIAMLRDVVRFYVTRDTDPQRWYPTGADGTVVKFDDLPPAYRGNVNTTEAPYNRAPGEAPALNDEEIDLVVEFLQTLTDDDLR